ncbi:MAG TPA: urease accessory protein UreE [Chitinophagaceae bacterium]|jgi:urease accessory protein|nr:urease accessory protein UreE [Chitinophagaceae bacterium]
MILVKEVLGRRSGFGAGLREDKLPIAWFEASRRILHKRTERGEEVACRFLKERSQLQQDDVLAADDRRLILVDIVPCTALVIRPATPYETALACYEIGNKHLPLFFEGGELLVPWEAPLERMLQGLEIAVTKEQRRLLHPLRTTVSPHAHSPGLLTRILQRTGGNHE